jgi:C4-dicarboxylate transporter DctM subunit
MLTPPLGANLFVAMRISRSTFENVLKEAMPCIGILLIVLLILIAFPQIIMVLPNLLKM